jgi:hypothetical protein
MSENASAVKKFLLELGFFIGIVIAVVLTAIDVVFGIFRYAYGRLVQGRPNFNPYADIASIWKAIGRHLSYLGKVVFVPAFRASVRKNRTRMHQRAVRAREAFRHTRDIHVFDDFDYTDGVDVVTFFLMLPYGIIGSIVLVHVIVSTIAVISVYGVYKHYQTTAVERKTPQQQTIVQYQPQVADKQETDFGPTWLNRGAVLDKVNDPGFLNVALLSDAGSIKYSATKVVEPSGFAPLAFSERVVNPSVTPTGQVHFLDQLQQEFTVNKDQAFLFEGYASKMFMFDDNGKLMAISPEAAKIR